MNSIILSLLFSVCSYFVPVITDNSFIDEHPVPFDECLEGIEHIGECEFCDSNIDLSVYNPNYYAYTYFSMENYFEELYEYSPQNGNTMGCCGYVALIQVMSYYDTFYNDNIIPDTYDRYSSNITTLNQAMNIAPGVLRQAYNKSIYQNKYNYCHSTMNSNFMSKLMVLENQILDFDNVADFRTGISMYEYQVLLDAFYQNNSTVDVEIYNYQPVITQQQQFINKTKDIIDSGHPAILHIRDTFVGGNVSRHAVVAYDYDDDYIYANFGWNSNETHLNIFNTNNGYNYIYDVCKLDFSSLSHLHSDNYLISNVGYCGCNPNNIPF